MGRGRRDERRGTVRAGAASGVSDPASAAPAAGSAGSWRKIRGGQPKQQHTSKRIFERLRDEHGYTGGITVVKDYVAKMLAFSVRIVCSSRTQVRDHQNHLIVRAKKFNFILMHRMWPAG